MDVGVALGEIRVPMELGLILERQEQKGSWGSSKRDKSTHGVDVALV